MTVNELMTAIVEDTGYDFAHFGWSSAPAGDYGVVSEDGAADLVVDGLHLEKSTTGTIDYFTRDDSGTPKDAIEAVLNETNNPWYLNNVLYENDTGYIHYEWVFGLYG